MQNKTKTFKQFLTVIAIIVGVGLLTIYVVKPLYAMNKANQGTELGFVKPYEQISRACPRGIELGLSCIRRFYAPGSELETQKLAIKNLTSKGYVVKQMPKGYDGPNQLAFVAYNAKKNIESIVVIIKTSNEKSKKGYGNVEVVTSSGGAYFNNTK